MPASSRSTCSASGCSPRSSAASRKSGRTRGRADRPLAHPARRPRDLRIDPGRRRRPASFRSRAARRCRCCRAPCPSDLDDLTVQVALVRPGPIQGGAIHPYIERRKLLREDPGFEVPYEHPLLEPVLEETLGTIVFQEQVIEVAMALAGFSSAEAEGLRRAMSRKRSEEAIARPPRALPRRAPRAAGSRSRIARARLGADPGLLGLRLPQGPLGRLRPARLPVGLAAGPPPARVPLLAAERAADGLLPARLARPRGPAARGADAPPPTSIAATSSATSSASAAALLVRIGLGYVKGVREEEMEAWSPSARRAAPTSGSPTSPRARGPAATGWSGWPGPAPSTGSRSAAAEWASPRGALAPRGRAERRVERREGTPAPASPRAARAARRWSRSGAGSEMIADYRSTGINLGEHPMALLRDRPRARRCCAAPTSSGSTTAPRSRSPAWSSPASGPRPPRGSSSCCFEDERGTVNLIVPPRRSMSAAGRWSAPRRCCGREGRLERRDGTINVLVAELRRAAPRPRRQVPQLNQLPRQPLGKFPAAE